MAIRGLIIQRGGTKNNDFDNNDNNSNENDLDNNNQSNNSLDSLDTNEKITNKDDFENFKDEVDRKIKEKKKEIRIKISI